MAAAVNQGCSPDIPDETLVSVFQGLDFESFGQIATVCKKWRDMLNEIFWVEIQKQRFPEAPGQPAGVPARDYVRHLLASVPLMHQFAFDTMDPLVGHMNIYRRKITIIDKYHNMEAAKAAILHPRMPNNSVVMFPLGNNRIPAIFLKDQNGKIVGESQVRRGNSIRDTQLTIYVRQHIGVLTHFRMEAIDPVTAGEIEGWWALLQEPSIVPPAADTDGEESDVD